LFPNSVYLSYFGYNKGLHKNKGQVLKTRFQNIKNLNLISGTV